MSSQETIVTSAIRVLVQQIKDNEIDGVEAVEELLSFQNRKARAEELKLHANGKCEDNDNYWRGIELTPEQVTARIRELTEVNGLVPPEKESSNGE